MDPDTVTGPTNVDPWANGGGGEAITSNETDGSRELAKVIPLHGRGADGELLARLRAALAHRGSVTVDLTSGAVSPQTWQRTAMRAAGELGFLARTGQAEREGCNLVTVWAVVIT